jgi:galactokinase
MEIDFRDQSLTYTSVNLNDYTWVALHSGKSRELASSAYDTRVQECQTGLEILKSRYPKLKSLRDAKREYLTGNAIWEKRVRHLINENERVQEVRIALSQNNCQEAGRLLTEGHLSLRDDYEVSCNELDTLITLAQEKESWAGGRMMGGGFGGCTINLVKREGVDEFISSVSKKYRKVFPDLSVRCFAFQAVAGARIES